MCVCAFSLRQESPDMILGDEPLISEVVLSHKLSYSFVEDWIFCYRDGTSVVAHKGNSLEDHS
jgi:hypothetical protein